MFKTFRSAVIAGFTIGLAGFGYLSMIGVLNGVVGAVVFAFGLLTIVGYKLKLFTGTAGFISVNKTDIRDLLIILVGNVIGCGIVALMTRVSPNDINCVAERILSGRVANGALRSGVLAIGCGFIMTTAVTFARKGNMLPLIFGVPLFIFCGFPHCLVDAFYILTSPISFVGANAGAVFATYGCVVLGNFIGCNLYRSVLPDAE
jgi:formate/nitrite transporter FocA (FNT family)